MAGDEMSDAQRAIEELRARIAHVGDDVLDLLLREARTHNDWQDKQIPDSLLREIYEVVKMGPTSGNCSPARFVFLRTEEAKRRLTPAMMAGNEDKTFNAPVNVIIGHDTRYYDQFIKLFHQRHEALAARHGGDADFAAATAFRNATLQGAYLIIAARAFGLDCGPMSGFDHEIVDREFFAGTTVKSNFICNLGYGNASKLFPRLYRFEFDEVCRMM